jgi:hypothetical protein
LGEGINILEECVEVALVKLVWQVFTNKTEIEGKTARRKRP